jgi:gamma-glutamylcyclotransferase (GGCT)/AIG2-like uncharacterized protein YtfP
MLHEASTKYIIKVNNATMKFTSAKMQIYFAYGSNMDVVQMKQRTGSASEIGIGSLAGYRFLINTRGVATIVPNPDSLVWGVGFECTDEALRSLDLREGVAKNINHREHQTVTFTSGCHQVISYVASDNQEGRPRPGYLEKILTAAQHWDLPEIYRTELTQWQIQL